VAEKAGEGMKAWAAVKVERGGEIYCQVWAPVVVEGPWPYRIVTLFEFLSGCQ